MITRRILATAVATSLCGVALAASPDQVGTWSGTAKIVTYAGATKTTTKQPMQLEIAADDQTTITLSGFQAVAGAAYNGTDGLMILVGVNGANITQAFANVNFKGTKIKGGGTGFINDGVVITSTLEMQIKLKKQ